MALMAKNDDEIKKLVAQLGIQIEDSFLSVFANDPDSAASLSLYLITYIFCRGSVGSRVTLMKIISKLYGSGNHVFEDFDDLKSWVDNIRIIYSMSYEEDREGSNRDAE
jgi:hypothetical protein